MGNSWIRRQKVRLRRPAQILAAPIFSNYVKLVLGTSSRVSDPPDYVARAWENHPQIIALWHGQFFLLPGIYPQEVPGRAMVSRHEDAEALARVLRGFGLELIRGAGAGERRRDRGGAEAAHGAVASLREGYSIAMTADVPPGPARKCGRGIVTIASMSGRPVVPFAVASSRYAAVNSWDRMTFNLPFSKLGIAMGDPIQVPPDLNVRELEPYRQQVEDALNVTTEKAYALAGADSARATPPKRR
ncbi:MAG: lysophospholipid acyltransferase family protein [Alphaproteobacteria bacterium]|jgi:3-deoxy-D-manno-octulosonic-acid transferase